MVCSPSPSHPEDPPRAPVLLLRLAAHPRPRQRTVHNRAVLIRATKNLGRGCHHYATARLQVDHVRRGVHYAAPIHVERIRVVERLNRSRAPAGKCRGEDVLLGLRHRAQKLILGHHRSVGAWELRQRHGHLTEGKAGRRLGLKRFTRDAKRSSPRRARRRRPPKIHVPGAPRRMLCGVIENDDVAVQAEAKIREFAIVLGSVVERKLSCTGSGRCRSPCSRPTLDGAPGRPAVRQGVQRSETPATMMGSLSSVRSRSPMM